MAVTDYPVSGEIGANFNRGTTSAEYALGQTARGTNNTVWIYVQATAAVATGTCTVNSSTFIVTDAAGTYTADTAFAAGEFGWVRQNAAFTA